MVDEVDPADLDGLSLKRALRTLPLWLRDPHEPGRHLGSLAHFELQPGHRIGNIVIGDIQPVPSCHMLACLAID